MSFEMVVLAVSVVLVSAVIGLAIVLVGGTSAQSSGQPKDKESGQ